MCHPRLIGWTVWPLEGVKFDLFGAFFRSIDNNLIIYIPVFNRDIPKVLYKPSLNGHCLNLHSFLN